jgi:hypothetical protein
VDGNGGVNVSFLPEPEKHPLWNDIRQLLKPAAEYGGIGIRDDGEFVWIAFDGPTIFAAMTTFYADGVAEIRLACGSRLNDWIAPFEAAVSAWARECGASKLIMRGREGWGRFARPFGWARLGTEDGKHLYEKAL